MYLYGAGGHAKVIIDIVIAAGKSIDALFDDNKELKNLLDYPVLPGEYVKGPLIVSIGHNKTRKWIVESLSVHFGLAIHPSAIVSGHAGIGEGSVVMQGSIIQSCTRIGRHCIINTGASVDHDCILDDYVHISPHATICGEITIGEGSWIGAGATIIPGVKIGKWSVVGAGSMITKDIPDYTLAVNNRGTLIEKAVSLSKDFGKL